MVTLTEDRSATLVIRVWLEGATDEFRGRLTGADTTRGGLGAEVTKGVASSPEQVLDVVRSWLDDFLAGPATGGR